MDRSPTPASDLSRWQRQLVPGGLLQADDGVRSLRDRLADAVLFLVAVSIGLGQLVDTWSQHGQPWGVLDGAAGLVACAGLWWRRRDHPFGIGLACAVASAVCAAATGAALVGTFNAGVRARQGELAAVAGTTFAAGLVAAAVYDGGHGFDLAGSITGTLVTGVAVGWGLFVRVRRALIVSVRERAERAESEGVLRMAQAREAERSRIAREMHDVLAHRLSLLSLHAGALEFRPDAPPEEVAQAAGVIRSSAHAALEELRDVVGMLREPAGADPVRPAPPQPTLAELPALVQASREAGVRVGLELSEPAQQPPPALQRTAYRIVQEGLTNARKHAPGAAVEVAVGAVDGPALEVVVRSRAPVGAAVGRAAALPGAGMGLVGLAERVDLAGGALEHGLDARGDFVLRARLPWAS